MTPKISKQKKDINLKIYYSFEAGSKRGAPFHSWNTIAKRTAHCFIKKIFSSGGDNEKCNNNAKSKTITRKDTIDQFDKHLINTVVYKRSLKIQKG